MSQETSRVALITGGARGQGAAHAAALAGTRRGGGSITNISFIAAHRGAAGYGAYSASKALILALTLRQRWSSRPRFGSIPLARAGSTPR